MNYSLQNEGVRIVRTVNSSRRPTNIINDKNHLANGCNDEKFPEGPVSPSPGPTLLIQVITEPIDSSNPVPNPARISELTRMIIK